MIGAAFLRALVEVSPYQIHAVLTDNGMAFADRPKNRTSPTAMMRGPRRRTPAARPGQAIGDLPGN